MQNHENPSTIGQESEVKSDALQRAFALALGRELDRIGYPVAPARTNQLSQDLGVGRMQAYRIGRGDNMPSLKALLKLQSFGVSLDAVLAQLQDERETNARTAEVTIEFLGVAVRAAMLPAYSRTPFAALQRDGQNVLRKLARGEEPAVDEVPVGGLRFIRQQPTVAIIEDDPSELAVLCKQVEPSFNPHPFERGLDLLADAERLANFDALVLDWRLPDIDGAALVTAIRAHTRAPIVVTTGERRESQAISHILHLPGIRYIAKPVDGSILRALLDSAISEAGVRPSAGAAWATKSVQSIE